MRYKQQFDGDWITPRMTGYYLQCCHCGCTHRLNFKVVKHGRGHKVRFQVFRLRKRKKKKK